MNRVFLRTAFAAALASLTLSAALPALADDGAVHASESVGQALSLGPIEISSAFARATLPNAPVGAAYVTLTNTGDQDDTLVSASSPAAGMVQLHNMSFENGVMKMKEMEVGIPIPAGETVTLKPGGFHIMLMRLNQQLKEGSTLPVTLTFEKAGAITLDIDIRDPGAMDAGMSGMEMSHGG